MRRQIDGGVGERRLRRRGKAAALPRRELVTLLWYVRTGSHRAGAHALGISESTSRQRVSQLCGRIGAANATQAAWVLRAELEREAS